jgi:uncharacterized protein (DUF2132 family)
LQLKHERSPPPPPPPEDSPNPELEAFQPFEAFQSKSSVRSSVKFGLNKNKKAIKQLFESVVSMLLSVAVASLLPQLSSAEHGRTRQK